MYPYLYVECNRTILFKLVITGVVHKTCFHKVFKVFMKVWVSTKLLRLFPIIIMEFRDPKRDVTC